MLAYAHQKKTLVVCKGTRKAKSYTRLNLSILVYSQKIQYLRTRQSKDLKANLTSLTFSYTESYTKYCYQHYLDLNEEPRIRKPCIFYAFIMCSLTQRIIFNEGFGNTDFNFLKIRKLKRETPHSVMRNKMHYRVSHEGIFRLA